MDKDLKSLMQGFSKLGRAERLARLQEMEILTPSEVEFLAQGAILDPALAEHFVENVIGVMQVPMGVAVNFRIDAKDYIIPMAVEETSIIAAASKTARWVRENGTLTTSIRGRQIIGQIQFPRVRSMEAIEKVVRQRYSELLEVANKVAAGLVRRGGGVQEFQVRSVDRGDGSNDKMAVIHVLADPCDAMGANVINQVCEALKPNLEMWTGERIGLCILSNLVDTKLTRAEIRMPGIDPSLGEGIAEASLFARQDPYRAATNNKGVMNGIDAVLLATGNDWRAVEAGVHAYAARSGRYSSITNWTMENGVLVGVLEAPIVVGTVGGVTALHPTARLALKMMNITSAENLSRVLASVGLVQNLGALRALSTVGVVQGHMRLHTANLAVAAGAVEDEIPWVQAKLEAILKRDRRVSLSEAVLALDEVRRNVSEKNLDSATESAHETYPRFE
jgi:hydroxymethylglutaryl-CoA reductase